MIEIDGSLGEGGGQVLRTSLTLSIITRQAFRISNIRKKRSTPGLMPQHLKSVDAAAAISKAQVEGAKLYSTSLSFIPSESKSGRYKFKIGTAGATTLVLQTVFLPLSLLDSTSSVIITGGTHVPWSPCFHYLSLQWMYFLKIIGFDLLLSLDLSGFFPQGGGKINATIKPAGIIQPLKLTQRGKLIRIMGISGVANLPLEIAERQKRQAILRLQKFFGSKLIPVRIKVENLRAVTKGTFILLLVEYEFGRGCFCSLGELGRRAERVADEAIDAIIDFIETDGVIDQYLADQLMLPLSVGTSESIIKTSQITQHILTNSEIIEMFLPTRISIIGETGHPGSIHIIPMR